MVALLAENESSHFPSKCGETTDPFGFISIQSSSFNTAKNVKFLPNLKCLAKEMCQKGNNSGRMRRCLSGTVGDTFKHILVGSATSRKAEFILFFLQKLSFILITGLLI